MSLMAAHERLEERVRVLEAKGAASSRNSSVAPSADTAISRQERRVLARATKELLKKDGQRRKAGGQPGHRGAGRGLLAEDQMKESATITRASARAADTSSRRLRRLAELIGTDFKGILCSDRWWAYDHIDPESRQACWEHLKRDWFRHSEGLAEQKEFGTAGLALTKQLFKTWHAFEEHQDRGRLIAEMAPIQEKLRTLVENAARKSARTRYHRRFAKNLLKIWPALFTFVIVEGVQPTNNAAERSLRGPVIYRKLSHGTQSEDGERFIERALSASVTCRLQDRSLFAYMRELLTAHARGDPLPTLA